MDLKDPVNLAVLEPLLLLLHQVDQVYQEIQKYQVYLEYHLGQAAQGNLVFQHCHFFQPCLVVLMVQWSQAAQEVHGALLDQKTQ